MHRFLKAIRQVLYSYFTFGGYFGFITLIFFSLDSWELPLWRVAVACTLIHGYAIYYEFMIRSKEDN